MAPEYSGRGDARRSMELLWGRAPRGSRGPKQGTDVESVVRAAIELADEEGLEAVSMRRVADRLGIGTMTLYTYVHGKGELLDLMLDTVHGEAADEPIPATGSIRDRLEAMARRQRAFFQRHPWTLSIASSRAVLGPNELDAYEGALSVVADAVADARSVVAIVDTIGLYVRGAARDAAEAAAAERVTGISETDWWTERDAILAEKMTAERFPTLTRIDAAGGFAVPPETENYNVQFIVDDFEFGLQRLLDGIVSHVEAAHSTRRGYRGGAPRTPKVRRP